MYLSLQSGEVQGNAAVSSPSTAVVKADILGVPGLPSNSWALVMFPHQLPGIRNERHSLAATLDVHKDHGHERAPQSQSLGLKSQTTWGQITELCKKSATVKLSGCTITDSEVKIKQQPL